MHCTPESTRRIRVNELCTYAYRENHRKYIELTYAENIDDFFSGSINTILTRLDDLNSGTLDRINRLLERDGMHNNDISFRMLKLILNDHSDEDMAYMVGVLERHLERILTLTYEGHPEFSELDVVNTFHLCSTMYPYFDSGMTLTPEQEWTMMRVHLSGYFSYNPVTGVGPYEHRFVSQKETVGYILENEDKLDAIISAMVDQKLTLPAQIDAYITGTGSSALLSGVL